MSKSSSPPGYFAVLRLWRDVELSTGQTVHVRDPEAGLIGMIPVFATKHAAILAAGDARILTLGVQDVPEGAREDPLKL